MPCAVSKKEHHALFAARDERPLRAEFGDKLACRLFERLFRIEMALEGGGKLRVVLLHIVDAREGAHAVARIDDRRNAALTAGGEKPLANPLRDRARAVVAQDDSVDMRQCRQEPLFQRLCKRKGKRLAALLVDAHDLLADRRPAARDDARLGNRRSFRSRQKSRRIDARLREHRGNPRTSRILAQHAESAHRAAQGRGIVRDVRRAARDDALAHLLQDEHGRLPRYARDAPVEVNVGDHVAEDKRASALQAFCRRCRIICRCRHFHTPHRVHHGVKFRRTLQLLRFAR